MVGNETIQIIIEGGAVGLALVSLGLVYYCIRVMTNHLVHVSELLGCLANQLERLTHWLERNGE
jgi:hypothetical protein